MVSQLQDWSKGRGIKATKKTEIKSDYTSLLKCHLWLVHFANYNKALNECLLYIFPLSRSPARHQCFNSRFYFFIRRRWQKNINFSAGDDQTGLTSSLNLDERKQTRRARISMKNVSRKETFQVFFPLCFDVLLLMTLNSICSSSRRVKRKRVRSFNLFFLRGMRKLISALL